MRRRNFVKLAAASACHGLFTKGLSALSGLPAEPTLPTQCNYAPPGEYIKDHTFVFHDGWWHLYSISGTAGLAWLYSGNEETLSWSISRDLASWELRGHVLHASLRQNTFDEDEIWAPFCLKANGRFYTYYAGCVRPVRPVQYDRRGSFGKIVGSGGRGCSIGLATSDDLTRWTKISDPVNGLGIPGRDPNVVRDEEHGRWLMYSTGVRVDGLSGAYVSQSTDLVNWKLIGPCVRFPRTPESGKRGYTLDCLSDLGDADTAESLTVMKHPLTQKWIMLGNWHFIISDDPTSFLRSEAQLYNLEFNGRAADLGFAGEIIQWQGKWYRSGVMGPLDNWKLGLTEIEWVPDGAFRIFTPSVLSGSWGDLKAGDCQDPTDRK